MTDNFLISLRNDTGCGCPGTSFGPAAAYMQIPESNTTYDLQKQIQKTDWLAHISDTTVLVFVHGFGNDVSKVVARHNSIKGHVPPGITLVSFDWPSGNSGFWAYRDDKQNAAMSVSNFNDDCLQVLLGSGKFKPANIHVFAHSMGAYVTEAALQTPKVYTLGHVLLAAADVDQAHYKDGAPQLKNLLGHCSDLTVYLSADDQALTESQNMPINQGAVPLGLKGFPDLLIPARCFSIDCKPYYESYVQNSPPPPNVSSEEFSHVWYLLYAPPPPPVNDFYTDMREVLQGLPTSPTRASKGINKFELQRPKA